MNLILNHTFYLKTLFLSLLFLPQLLLAQFEEEFNDYWTLVPGIKGDPIILLDTSMVFVSRDYGYVNETMVMQNTINLHHFDKNGDLFNSFNFNISDTDWISMAEAIYSPSKHQVHQLANGNFLMGGQGTVIQSIGDLQNIKEKPSQKMSAEKTGIIKKFKFEFETGKDDTLHPLVHPMIFTFNPQLDSLLRIDTLEAVPAFGAVTLIHEVAPDTLIIGFHKSSPSNQQIMETDSLFNIRWSTEFGYQYGWIADIYDFQIASDKNYLVSMVYYTHTSGSNPYGKWKNRLFKFDSTTGELLWHDKIWKNKGMNSRAAMAPWQDDKIVIALDDCCENLSYFNEIIFHEHTGMHLQIRDHDGNILEEKNLTDFLNAFVYTFEGPSAIGHDLEDPENAYPWFIPYRIIRNPDDTYLITGQQYSDNKRTFGRGFLVKLDQNLEPLWARIFEIDKKNYIYANNRVWLFDILNAESGIFLGGSLVCLDFSGITSPYYPPNYLWDPLFRMDLFIPLDEHGCYEPGCHLSDNVPEWEWESYISMYPNPASDRLHISIQRPAIEHLHKTLFISDMQGHGILTQSFTGNSLNVSLENFSPGIYLVYIMTGQNLLRAGKVVVK
jgi:hypothetical protein